MTDDQDQKKEEIIQVIAESMRSHGFSVEYKVCKKPEGIKVVFEVTQDQMDHLVNHFRQRKKTKL